ncbi:cell wall hydrolase [Alkaliphilus sp. B6464]|uniref:cell wall hydrolase n=1 Tax=Alkaliphilus sp. B6464 TaxID=2731219 RepID=UPI001BAD52D4|nr:cell wall hydrolase [Alkaliphilus sp. B6464]QUH21198.1 cell wall hydrolase [Alkaliphilus sp. B6464]
MKSILEKYKILLISSGILLSIIVLFSTINSNFSKENLTKNSREAEISSIAEVMENDEDEVEAEEKNIAEVTDEEVPIVIEDNNEANDKKENDIKTFTNIKDNSTSSSPITGEKYTVKKGDTLFLIAQRANVSANHLKQLNNLSSDMIYENQTLKIKGSVNNSSSQVASRGSDRSEDLYWLSRVIHAEAQGESYEGKVAVGNVIMNRVNSGKFPNTIKGVVFDKQDGYTQFSPVLDGSIYNTPNAESIKAATDVLNGARPVGNALYFLNPRKSTNFWIIQNRQYIKTIGLHDFYY